MTRFCSGGDFRFGLKGGQSKPPASKLRNRQRVQDEITHVIWDILALGVSLHRVVRDLFEKGVDIVLLVYILYIKRIYTYEKEETVEIIISNGSDKPIYEQIEQQLKDAILSGELSAGEQLPSIRMLASDLRVSVITTKRAYQDLENLGFVETVQGKGTFVSLGSLVIQREQRIAAVRTNLSHALAGARASGVSLEQLHEMLDQLAESE